MISLDLGSENLISILGALFDIAGATLLARALICVKAAGIIRQSASGYAGLSPPLVKMFSEQKVDALFGLGMLWLGFALQGAAGYGYKSARSEIFALGVAILFLVLITYFSTRGRWTRHSFNQAFRILHNADGTARFTQVQVDELWGKEKSAPQL